MIKKCKICNLEKEIDKFVKNKNSKNGYENICKVCKNTRMRVYKKSDEYRECKRKYSRKS